MKNNNWIRKYSKVFCGILAAAMVMASLTACGSGETASGINSETTQEDTEQTGTESSMATQELDTIEGAATYRGEITAIDGNGITIALAEMPGTPDHIQLPQDATGEPVIREGEPSGETPGGEAPQGRAPGNGEGGMNAAAEMELQLTGETITVTADESTIITVDDQEASLADLEVGNTVTVIMQGEKVNSIIVGFAPQGDRLKPDEKPEDKKPGEAESVESKLKETEPQRTEQPAR